MRLLVCFQLIDQVKLPGAVYNLLRVALKALMGLDLGGPSSKGTKINVFLEGLQFLIEVIGTHFF